MDASNDAKLEKYMEKWKRIESPSRITNPRATKRVKLMDNLDNIEDSTIVNANNYEASEITEEAQVEQELTDARPNLEGEFLSGEADVNLVREEVIKKVLESNDKFQAFDDKYKDLSQNRLIDERPIDVDAITDPELRKLLEQFKFIKIGGINRLGEWKQVVYRQSCQILLNTKNASEFVNAFDEIAEFIRHGKHNFSTYFTSNLRYIFIILIQCVKNSAKLV